MGTKITAFFRDVLEAPLRNPAWSWGAYDRSRNIVYLRVWKDQSTKRGNTQEVQIGYKRAKKGSKGYPERVRHIEAIKAGAKGYAIICEAKNPHAKRRVIKSFNSRSLYRLGGLRERKKGLYAEIVEEVPVSEAMETRVLFARIGYMRYYAGPQEGDEKPIGGGKYNENNIGHEAFNFKPIGEHLWGYVQPHANSPQHFRAKINLRRITPSARNANSVSGVRVIFVARHEGRQVIVGWYNNATVYRSPQQPTRAMKRERFRYNIMAWRADAVLLPVTARTHKIQHGAAGMGQTNACYLLDAKGKRKRVRWINKALNYINNYSERNIVASPEDAEEEDAAMLLEARREARSGGQGIRISSEMRRNIEKRAEDTAEKYFRRKGYNVINVGKWKSYDLECRKGGATLRVEVKGTQTRGDSVNLTSNEVANARNHKTALFILHSIKIKPKGRKKTSVAGGIPKVYDPWHIDEVGNLRTRIYEYRLKK